MHVYHSQWDHGSSVRRCHPGLCSTSAAAFQVARVVDAITALDFCMSSSRPRLNSNETNFIWLAGRSQLAKIDLILLRARFPDVNYSDSVRDLDITIESVISLSDHVNRIF